MKRSAVLKEEIIPPTSDETELAYFLGQLAFRLYVSGDIQLTEEDNCDTAEE